MANLACSSCKETKDESLFPKATGKARGYAWICKRCKIVKRKEKQASMSQEDWASLNRSYWLKSQYNMSLEDYNKLLREQNHKCKICKIDETEVMKQTLYVDHNHQTGEIRGLLCHHCNAGLGHFRDTIALLDEAKAYLQGQNNG
jgi:hypothetical protein